MSLVAGACFNMHGVQPVLSRNMATGDQQIAEVFAGVLPMLSKEGRRSPTPENPEKAPSQKKQKLAEGDQDMQQAPAKAGEASASASGDQFCSNCRDWRTGGRQHRRQSRSQQQHRPRDQQAQTPQMQELLTLMGKLQLRQEDELAQLRLDKQFLLHMTPTGSPESILGTLYQVALT